MGPKFAWQRGFGGFSVSASNADAVVRYIRDQEKHHRKMSYEEEIFAHFLRELLPLVAAFGPASGRGSGGEC